MLPAYKYGYRAPSTIKMIVYTICFFVFPYLLTLLITNLITSSKFSPGQFSIIAIYLVCLFIALLIIYSFQTRGIYLFYHNFMLYKEKLNLRDRLAIFLAHEDLGKLENILNKRNYVNINELKIIIKQFQYMRTNEQVLSIEFQLDFNDHKSFTINVIEETKEAYRQFLDPFIKYHVNIIDPYNFIDGLDQPMRLIEYFEQQQKLTNS